ncbi:barstar family protein [Arthrobacter sp. NPDC090010]|uniref:barstar family protein n=1 Tax=Arthrobacter sp. NPDC090010 TaxID=3363942 RepID=UPI00382EFE69
MRSYDARRYTLAELEHAALSQGREAYAVPRAPDRTGVLDAFAVALGFPEYYGRNLDALNDCLGEWAAQLSYPSILMWEKAPELDDATASAIAEILTVTEGQTGHLAVVVLD